MKRKQTMTGVTLTLLGGCFWGLCGACAQYLFRTEHVTSNFLVPWRMTLAGAVLLGWHLVRSPKQLLGPWKSGRDALQLLLYAIFGMAMCQYAYFATIELSNAGTATVLQYAAPAMLLLVVCCLERRWPGRIEVLAVVCASAGVFLLATHGNFGTLAISGKTLAMGMVAALAVVAYNLLPRRLLQRFSAPLLLGWGMFLGGLLLCVTLRPWRYHVALTPRLVLCIGRDHRVLYAVYDGHEAHRADEGGAVCLHRAGGGRGTLRRLAEGPIHGDGSFGLCPDPLHDGDPGGAGPEK